MQNKYHIFRVYDYKGGELSTSLNLSKEGFIEEIFEDFIHCDEIEFNKETPDVLKLSKDILENIIELGIYAGGDSQVADFFYTRIESPLITAFDIEDFIKDNILDVVKIYCENEEYDLTKEDVELLNNIDKINDSSGIELNNSRNIPLV